MNQLSTLDLVLQISQGALLVPLKKTATILGLETQTIRNRLCEKRFELSPVKIGRLNYFRVADIAAFIDSSSQVSEKPARGRPRKSAVARKVGKPSAGA
ncbi:MAG TPA: helix-turn-helix domain-containing protein [Noviherbaspirillum sp.]|nr:helix-turn-helix domain-containing protein [Noviherbaspirillum sp.]